MFSKTKWPFKNLAIGESCTVPEELAERAKRYVHVYASQSGKRMRCRTNPDGSVTVTRIPEKGLNGVRFTAEEVAMLGQLFPDKTQLRAFGRVVAGPYSAFRTEDGGIFFEPKAV